MGLFGGGNLRREIAALTEELTAARRNLDTAQADVDALRKKLADKEDKERVAREGRKKAEQKLEKLQGARKGADDKASGLQERVTHLEGELADYRRGLLAAKEEAESARVRAMDLEQKLDAARKAAEVKAAPAPEKAAPAPEAPRKPREEDPRLERLREQLAEARAARDELRGRLVDAEKTARDAERKRASEVGEAQAAVRDLQHHLRSERRAYKILQLQFEAQVDRARGAEQQVQARVEAALARAPEAEHGPTPSAAPAAAPAAPKPLVEVVPDDAPST